MYAGLDLPEGLSVIIVTYAQGKELMASPSHDDPMGLALAVTVEDIHFHRGTVLSAALNSCLFLRYTGSYP